jgi:hypothetical protein
MAHSTSRNGQSPIEEVIDGINDADIPAEEKQRLLKRIEKEGGVYSQALREDLIRVFDEQAAQERQNIRDNDALLKKLDAERAAAGTLDDLGDDSQIAAEMMAEQGRIAKQIDDDVLTMRSDVMGMERQVSQVEEGQRGAIEQEEIDRLRKGLQK